jgi:hypothetical protein
LGVALSDGTGVDGFGGAGGYLQYTIDMSCSLGEIPFFGDIDGEYVRTWSGSNNNLFANNIYIVDVMISFVLLGQTGHLRPGEIHLETTRANLT